MRIITFLLFFLSFILVKAQKNNLFENYFAQAFFTDLTTPPIHYAAFSSPNTKKSNLSKFEKAIFLKENISYQDHLFEAASFSVPLIHNYRQLDELISENKLITVPEEGNGYYVQKLTHSKAFLYPAAYDVLIEISDRFYAETSKKLSISSLTRTMESQGKLRRVNSNAAKGESTHAYGAAFDISYSQYNNVRGRNYKYEKILQTILEEMAAEGKIYYIKEKRQPCFHITLRNSDLIYPEELSQLINWQVFK
ncbi:MAG: DUF5715 family protein [Weeksellaceae bacterium]|jgi:hypothetical protein|nr:DUF5715 family protein [Weeksellaceae bacterium]MDX9704993.1 DUF5715 family protein [Weeksellaceae bacterium]